MMLKVNDRRSSCPCHNEFRGPRSDYVRQNTVMDMNDLKPTPKIARPLKETLAMFRKRAKTPTAPSRLPELQHASKKNIE
ncbi:hypothetical protein TNCV_1182471 [Trichonephila clavipes]|nr:hypothetical protein TNCV_1182471 [Trichonephila clavipes]